MITKQSCAFPLEHRTLDECDVSRSLPIFCMVLYFERLIYEGICGMMESDVVWKECVYAIDQEAVLCC